MLSDVKRSSPMRAAIGRENTPLASSPVFISELFFILDEPEANRREINQLRRSRVSIDRRVIDSVSRCFIASNFRRAARELRRKRRRKLLVKLSERADVGRYISPSRFTSLLLRVAKNVSRGYHISMILVI